MYLRLGDCDAGDSIIFTIQTKQLSKQPNPNMLLHKSTEGTKDGREEEKEDGGRGIYHLQIRYFST